MKPDDEGPRKGWTRWTYGGNPEAAVGAVWWDAVILHFPKDNVTHWYDGSELVGEWKWGIHRDRYRMKKPPAGWKPWPGQREATESAWKDWREKCAARVVERADGAV